MVEAIKNGQITLRGTMVDFQRYVGVERSSDLDAALLNQIPLEQVRRMCKILAPFYAFYDANGDNQIDFDEFRMIFRDLHEHIDREAQERMFERADLDSDGFVGFEEFVSCLISLAISMAVQEKDEGVRAGSKRA